MAGVGGRSMSSATQLQKRQGTQGQGGGLGGGGGGGGGRWVLGRSSPFPKASHHATSQGGREVGFWVGEIREKEIADKGDQPD